jgi:hypothetical protein
VKGEMVKGRKARKRHIMKSPTVKEFVHMTVLPQSAARFLL